MQIRLLHLLLLLLALVFGPGAAASTVVESQAAGVRRAPSLHLTLQQLFEQVGLVEDRRLKKRLYRLPIAGFTMLGSPPCAARPELRPVEA
jgi:hypothetical protein